MVFTGFYRVSLQVLLGFTRFFQVSITCTALYWVGLGFTGVGFNIDSIYWVFTGSTRVLWVLVGLVGFDWVFIAFNGIYWVFTEFLWVLLGFTGFK